RVKAELARLANEKAAAEQALAKSKREAAAIESARATARSERAARPTREPAASERAAPRVATVDASPVRPMGATTLGGVVFHGEEGYAHLDIAVAGDVKVTMGAMTRTRAELILDGVDVAMRLEGVVDVMRFGSPIRSVRTYRDPQSPKRVRVILELIAPVTSRVQQTGTGLRWKLQGIDMA
ncbi:MAG: hypothetical protein ACKV2T_00220, partial [Kofleriaceae bacterium]